MAGASIVGTGLITVDVTHKDGRAYAKTILLSCGKIGEAWDNSSSTADFYYDIEAGRGPAVRFTATTLTKSTLTTAIENADTGNPRFQIHVMTENRGRSGEVAVDRLVTIYTEDILWGVDINTTTSYLYVKRGYDRVRLKTSHILTDIVSSASTSRSLSAS
jgi:hypothetical protein